MATNRIKQFQVAGYVGKAGRSRPSGEVLAFMAFTKVECLELLAAWLGRLDKGWKATRSTYVVRRGEVAWKVLTGTTVP